MQPHVCSNIKTLISSWNRIITFPCWIIFFIFHLWGFFCVCVSDYLLQLTLAASGGCQSSAERLLLHFLPGKKNDACHSLGLSASCGEPFQINGSARVWHVCRCATWERRLCGVKEGWGGLNRPAGVEQQYSHKATYCWIFSKAGGSWSRWSGLGWGRGGCLMRFTKASWHSGRECEMCSWMIFMAARW